MSNNEEKELTPNEQFIATELANYMNKNKDKFVENAHKALIEKLGEQIKWSGHDIINEQVRKFYQEEIVPEVAKYLAEKKNFLLKGILDSMDIICVEIGKALIEEVKGKLGEGYKRRQVFKALFD